MAALDAAADDLSAADDAALVTIAAAWHRLETVVAARKHATGVSDVLCKRDFLTGLEHDRGYG